MNDLLVVLMTVGFFAVCIAYVALCDRIVGPDDRTTSRRSPMPAPVRPRSPCPTEVAR